MCSPFFLCSAGIGRGRAWGVAADGPGPGTVGYRRVFSPVIRPGGERRLDRSADGVIETGPAPAVEGASGSSILLRGDTGVCGRCEDADGGPSAFSRVTPPLGRSSQQVGREPCGSVASAATGRSEEPGVAAGVPEAR